VKAITLSDIQQMKIVDIPMPKIKADTDVLLKIEEVGVCGSDVHYYETGRIGDQIIEYPFVVGHECAAIVAEVGSAVTRVRVGDRVAIDPALSCFACEQCRVGRENTCEQLRFLGCPGQAAGCLCEYIVMPQGCCYTLGDLSFSQGVLCEPLAIGVYAAQQACTSEGMDAAILGAGPIGLSCLVSARALGARTCFVTDLIDARLDVAKAQGADWTVNPQHANVEEQILKQQASGVDVVFECAGQQATVDQALEVLKPGGTLMLIGIPREERIDLDIHTARRKELTLVNVRRQKRCTQTAIDWMADGQLDVEFMVTHRFAADQCQQAFDLVAQYEDGVIKAMVEF
jgi:L-iditol 2-dehydrogenase